MSKMAVTNEATQYQRYFNMNFVEFLEFLARLGELRFRELQQTLSWKI